MSGWRLVLAWPIGLGGALLAAATLLGFLGRQWWGFDLLSSFRPQYLAGLLATGALAMAVIGPGAGIAFLAAAAINAAVIAPFYVANGPAAADGAPTVDIVAFNVQASNRQRPAIMDWVRNTDADLVFLIESSFEWEDAAERAALPYTIQERVQGTSVFGVTLLVRDGVAATSRPLQFGDRPAVEAVVDLGGSPVSVLAIHPRSPTSRERADRRDRYLRDVSVWARAQQNPVLIVGDFNATPWSSSFRRLTAGAGLRNSQVGHGLQPSFPAGWGPLMIPIDHALHSPDLAIATRGTGPALGSDHRPLLVSVAHALT